MNEFNGSKRFRLVTELGHGSYATVWQAFDRRLNRDVALKVLHKSRLNEEDVQRFLREANTAAGLSHPNIVQVFDATPERSEGSDQPYIVCELIEGVTLTDWAQVFRSKPREMASLLAKIADALTVAHASGVVHRDLKPDNILVDLSGEPHVADFGLASNEDVRMTSDNSMIGAIAYMSPEQAAGKSKDADARSDIYSLGVILYELLTGQLPFRGGPAEYLLQVQRNDAPDPRVLNKTASRDLCVICMKCLSKYPMHRFQSAAEVADELRRFVDGVPIESRPIRRWERLWRWSLRRPAVAGLSAALTCSFVVGVAGIAWQWREAQANYLREQDALAAETEARLEAADVAELTMDALRDMFGRVTERFIAQRAELTEADREFLKNLEVHYSRFADTQGDSQKSQAIRAESDLNVAVLWAHLGEKAEEVKERFDDAKRHCMELTTDFPSVPEYFEWLAKSCSGLGSALADLGKPRPAEREYIEAEKLFRRLSTDFPQEGSYKRELAGTQNNLGALLKSVNRRPEAKARFRESISILEELAESPDARQRDHEYLARSHMNLGTLLAEEQRLGEAKAKISCALEIQKQLAAAFPREPQYQLDVAKTHINLGLLHKRHAKREAAIAEYRTAISVLKQSAAEFPVLPKVRQELAVAHSYYANLLKELKKPSEALTEYQHALKLQRQLTADFPDELSYALELGGTYCNMGHLVRDGSQPAEALEWYDQAIKILGGPLFKKHPQLVVARQYLQRTYSGKAEALMELGRHSEAVNEWNEVLDLEGGPRQRPLIRLNRALCIARDDPAKAVLEADECVQGDTIPANWLYEAACVFAQAATYVKDSTDRDRYAARAIALVESARDKGFFRDKRWITHLRPDANLRVLRSVSEFKKLLAELEQNAPSNHKRTIQTKGFE